MDEDRPITLDQLEVFLRVVEKGTFSGAARLLGRAQSAVSYAIGNLEGQLGISLFDRSGRLPTLTPTGAELVAEARAVTEQAARLRSRARAAAAGTEVHVSVAIDAFLPRPPLVDALRAFRSEFPLVSLSLHSEALGAVAQLILEGVCQVEIGGHLPAGVRLEAEPFPPIRMVSVAAPSHQLACHPGWIPTSLLRDHVQMVLSDRSRMTEGVDYGVLSRRTWRVSDLETKRTLLLAGFGWGSMPRHLVDDDIQAERLVVLPLAERSGQDLRVPLRVVFRAASPPGRAARWLIERLREGCAPGGPPAPEPGAP